MCHSAASVLFISSAVLLREIAFCTACYLRSSLLAMLQVQTLQSCILLTCVTQHELCISDAPPHAAPRHAHRACCRCIQLLKQDSLEPGTLCAGLCHPPNLSFCLCLPQDEPLLPIHTCCWTFNAPFNPSCRMSLRNVSNLVRGFQLLDYTPDAPSDPIPPSSPGAGTDVYTLAASRAKQWLKVCMSVCVCVSLQRACACFFCSAICSGMHGRER